MTELEKFKERWAYRMRNQLFPERCAGRAEEVLIQAIDELVGAVPESNMRPEPNEFNPAKRFGYDEDYDTRDIRKEFYANVRKLNEEKK